MNWIDALILIIMVLSSIFGIWRGLVREIFSLVTWIFALLVARRYSDVLANLLFSSFDNQTISYVVAFALIFIIVMMLGTLLNFLLSKLLVFTGLKFIDRLLGGVFGIARGVIISFIGLFASSFFFSQAQVWQQSKLIPYGQNMIEISRVFIQDRNGTAEVSQLKSKADI